MKKGQKLSEKQKINLDLSGLKLGHGWNKGTKGVTKAWNKGKKGVYSEETKQKMREAKKGKHHSEETKELLKKIARRGEKNHNWKGGITPESEKIRKSLEMKLWKKSCLERDNFTCQKTGERGGRLVVHHINNFADFPRNVWDSTSAIMVGTTPNTLTTNIDNGVGVRQVMRIGRASGAGRFSSENPVNTFSTGTGVPTAVTKSTIYNTYDNSTEVDWVAIKKFVATEPAFFSAVM